GGDDSRPKQPLRQREYQHQDRSRARPHADRDNCGEPALPSSRPCELFRLRRVCVPPGRGFFVRMRMMVRFAVRMAVLIVLMSMMVMVRMMVMVAMVVVARMIVGLWRRGGAEGHGSVERPQKRQKRAPLHPQQSQPNENDERIAHDFDRVHRTAHGR